MRTLFKHQNNIQKDFDKIYNLINNFDKKLKEEKIERVNIEEEVKILKRKINKLNGVSS